MSLASVARRYARALFEIGKEERNLPALTKEIGNVARVYAESKELREVFESPTVPEDARTRVLDDIAARLGVSPTSKRALTLLAQNARLSILPELSRELTRLSDEDAGVLRAQVTSAGPLSSPYLERLRAELEKGTGQKVIVSHRVDEALIAGVVTKIGDRVIDGSLRAKLDAFRETMQTTART